jgi:hypothetical protein
MRLTAELLGQSGLGSVSDAEEAAAALAEAAGSKDGRIQPVVATPSGLSRVREY